MFFGNDRHDYFPTHKIGVSENADLRCIVYVHEGKPQIAWQNRAESADITPVQRGKFEGDFCIVQSLPHHHIWRRYLIFEFLYTDEEIYDAVFEHIQQELPIPLDEVHLDFHQTHYGKKLADAIRVVIFALRKEALPAEITDAMNLFDCELHCLVRAYHFLDQSPCDDTEIEENCYKFGDTYFQLAQDCVKVGTEPQTENICDLNKFTLSEEIRDPILYFKALGASLWNGTV